MGRSRLRSELHEVAETGGRHALGNRNGSPHIDKHHGEVNLGPAAALQDVLCSLSWRRRHVNAAAAQVAGEQKSKILQRMRQVFAILPRE
jgi:hypothetical protein